MDLMKIINSGISLAGSVLGPSRDAASALATRHETEDRRECAGRVLQSCVVPDYRRHSNFTTSSHSCDIDLPDEESYLPSLFLKLVETRNSNNCFSSFHLTDLGGPLDSRPSFVRSTNILVNIGEPATSATPDACLRQIHVVFPWTNEHTSFLVGDNSEDEDGEEDLDWWSRYYISTNQWPMVEEEAVLSGTNPLPVLSSQNMAPVPRTSLPRASIAGLQASTADLSRDAAGFVVYPCELESVPEFHGFQEWLHSFPLTKGKKFTRNALKEQVVAIFKGCFRIYRTPLPNWAADHALPTPLGQDGLFGGVPANIPTRVLVRAYMIKAVNLSAADVTGTSDPYVVLKLGRQRLSDRENYVSKQLNPFFGKCFEFAATFPTDAVLRVQIYDWDLVKSDDLIGETIIDLENRFYSRHRPTCGIARRYETSCANGWRDALRPTEILAKLCREDRLDGPHMSETTIRIGTDVYDFQKHGFGDGVADKENMALALLHRWSEISPCRYSLTPEHVETRTLYHPKKPGESQGQLVMWLDMFEENTAPPSVPRDISLRKPESFELRVIIWNTDEVTLADSAFLTGERMSDIYVKGWLTGKEDAQRTDVHYRSLTGEGNFNWRFVFPFAYLKAERKAVVQRKAFHFALDKTEYKVPLRLHLEAWDADYFKKDDILGVITLDLNRFPRGAKSAKRCTLETLKNGPKVSIFKQRRIRGWWPFSTTDTKKMKLTGKLEAEFELLTPEEAEKSPVGLGRQEPEALPKPQRPETSFLNILHPWKSLRYAFWRNYRGKILKLIAFFAFLLLFALFLYSVPGYLAKRMLGA
ncbi:hypothetical protein JTE90_007950 [Oedothorax gibbosus]|uniref:C2 domain-containing protein n=1 Tax=Oedothorax gibbosus TaxID=931172 RepID=A0AAV6VJC5_9ARAC|nr:hypothetical protein JTE90_007950 [Oedothorax gibbosus]